MNQLAHSFKVADLIREYEEKVEGAADAVKAITDAYTDLDMASTVFGTYADRVATAPYLHADTIRRNLLLSGWKAVYNHLQIDSIASAADKKRFERDMAKPPALTMENAKATFGDYLLRPRFHILRGLAEVFCSLDPAYKSHSKVRIGVKGLPKRVILSGWGEYGGWGRDRFNDIANALAAVRNQPALDHIERSGIDEAHRNGEDARLDGTIMRAPLSREPNAPKSPGIDRGITVRRFQNGNAHVFFDKWALLDINSALAEFYGEVLPDAEPEDVKPSASTAVAKDLQFYWTPPEAVALVLEYASVWSERQYSGQRPALTILEPSCGDGRILDGIRERGYEALGIEYHPSRAAECRAKGHAVVTGNFLEQPPEPIYDRVVMNPPFYGKHYVKHVRHAEKFLKPGGILVAILPATARYDHGELEGDWQDLPVASFAEAGTNVPTIMLRIRKR